MKKNNINLSTRETEILELLSVGYSTPEIASLLYLSSETIKTHRRNLILKLDARNVANLIRIGIEGEYIRTKHSIENNSYQFQSNLELVA